MVHQTLTQSNILAGDYQVRLIVGDSVVFDSGAVVLSANSNLTIAAINTGDSSSSLPVKQLVLDDSSSSIIEITGNQAKFESGILSMALRVIR
ncbi:hypothetical protein K6U16_12540 [Vibrio parahaemolyticus]|nr:hypothetical protein [Vibrio parahaemolyticus]ETS21238.1 putative 2-dehydropantoate 2-reductase [Vibrio parahaemolyticus B-265]ETT10468.1 putative 2-dehydropantoate 2-reductase [Vibrio parahaemolyticus 605]ETX25929.1 putative 2-dehydropantoate 2-reductase [Vibrio parahaemolyticus IDH02640]ETX55535.1 putative 2-dehydropantoate 2-reductase [Vibrio parahaemolyticus IDH02189]EUD15020.1 putative 2-dehydropantoate 2-reductase [Vibrio parahaemolyticus EKP-026]EVT79469.1 putative 2-dehydropantoate